jgi:hypothetical protein
LELFLLRIDPLASRLFSGRQFEVSKPSILTRALYQQCILKASPARLTIARLAI